MARRSAEVVRELIDAIVGGEYPEGSWLPHEQELCQRFGIGRSVLRDALLGLELRGLIASAPGRGHVVRQREAWDARTPDVLLALIARGPDPTVLSQVIRAREVIERAAAVLAGERAGEEDLGLLSARLREMEEALDPGALRSFDASDPLVDAEAWFHRALVQLSGNPLLANLVEPWHLPLAELRRVRAPERDRAVVQHHKRILEGVSSREPPLAVESIAGYSRQLRRWLGAGR
jgi:GntR family galactonate operon transcriptional repressor